MLRKLLIAVPIALIVLITGFLLILAISYNWCPFGTSLQLTRKTGKPSPKGEYAGPGEQGVQKQLRGPGRHFLNPWTWNLRRVDDVVIAPGEIAVVKNQIGKDVTEDRFIVGPDEKGTQRAVLTPGVWRINRFGQVVEPRKATIIKPGYVGVQTLQETAKKGILPTVLQAGYYNINPVRIRVDPVEIGYRVWDIHTEQVTDAAGRNAGRIKTGSGVSFPLADGKQMHLDFTVVWGIFPEDAPRIIETYGTVEMVERKIIEPQVLSICKNAGSNLTTQQFIEGETRQKFQDEVTRALQEIGQEKGIHFLIALVRGFHPAEDIKTTIQARMLAEEEKTTLKIEQQRDTVAARLEQAQRMVDVAVKDFDAETEALVKEELERGQKKAAEIMAEADRKVAQLQKKAAELDAQRVRILGQADADVIEAKKRAEAKRLELLIGAYGGASPYNLATFAESLPEDISIEFRYSGEGTFWTDTEQSLLEKAARKTLGTSSDEEPDEESDDD